MRLPPKGLVQEIVMETLQQTVRTKTSERRPGCGRELCALRLKEYVSFDSLVCRKLIALLGLIAGSVSSLCGQTAKAFRVFSVIHRAAYSKWASKIVERWVRARLCKYRQAFAAISDGHLESLSSSAATAAFHKNPAKLLGTRVLVLKAPVANEKGVILISYTFALSLFAKEYDVARIAPHYRFVLEPSWSGYCDLDLLCYCKFDFPVLVQAPEPRDAAFLRTIASNLIPVPLGDNCWVDHRVYRPLPGVAKDVDVLMVGSWGPYKRHYRFFSALATLRARGEKLRAVLLGYPGYYVMDDILRQAQYYGVDDQLEVYERLPPEEVNVQLNRSKVNLLWSRREGCNRATIEGMFADVPCIIRDGFNYGHHYAHINPQTGCFSSERALPERILWVMRNRDKFAPRAWVLQHMTCQRSTAILNEAIRQVATAAGENWTRDLAVKLTYVDRMRYWDEDEGRQFESDYSFLHSVMRK
jgi:glycosyltransferase involved in cell wall biosynthesis